MGTRVLAEERCVLNPRLDRGDDNGVITLRLARGGLMMARDGERLVLMRTVLVRREGGEIVTTEAERLLLIPFRRGEMILTDGERFSFFVKGSTLTARLLRGGCGEDKTSSESERGRGGLDSKETISCGGSKPFVCMPRGADDNFPRRGT